MYHAWNARMMYRSGVYEEEEYRRNLLACIPVRVPAATATHPAAARPRPSPHLAGEGTDARGRTRGGSQARSRNQRNSDSGGGPAKGSSGSAGPRAESGGFSFAVSQLFSRRRGPSPDPTPPRPFAGGNSDGIRVNSESRELGRTTRTPCENEEDGPCPQSSGGELDEHSRESPRLERESPETMARSCVAGGNLSSSTPRACSPRMRRKRSPEVIFCHCSAKRQGAGPTGFPGGPEGTGFGSLQTRGDERKAVQPALEQKSVGSVHEHPIRGALSAVGREEVSISDSSEWLSPRMSNLSCGSGQWAGGSSVEAEDEEVSSRLLPADAGTAAEEGPQSVSARDEIPLDKTESHRVPCDSVNPSISVDFKVRLEQAERVITLLEEQNKELRHRTQVLQDEVCHLKLESKLVNRREDHSGGVLLTDTVHSEEKKPSAAEVLIEDELWKLRTDVSALQSELPHIRASLASVEVDNEHLRLEKLSLEKQIQHALQKQTEERAAVAAERRELEQEKHRLYSSCYASEKRAQQRLSSARQLLVSMAVPRIKALSSRNALHSSASSGPS